MQHCKPNPPLLSLNVDVGYFPTLTSSRTTRRNCSRQSRSKCDKDVMKMDIYRERQPFRMMCGLFSPLVLSQAIMNRRTESEGEEKGRSFFHACIIALNFHTMEKCDPEKFLVSTIFGCFLFVLGNVYLAT